MLIFGSLMFLAQSILTVSAAPQKLTVTIDSIRFPEYTSEDFPKDSKFFAIVEIFGSPRAYNCEGRMAPNADGVINANWKFTAEVDPDHMSPGFRPPVYIYVQEIPALFERDPDFKAEAWCNMLAVVGGDPYEYYVDDDVGLKKNIRFDVSLAPCAVIVPRLLLPHSCGTPIDFHPVPRDTKSADVTFRVDMEETASAADLNVRCMHSPLWPQDTDTVTITADALDNNLALKSVDSIQIWVNSKAGPVQTAPGSSLTYTGGPFNSVFSYGCRVIHHGVAVFSGWRTVTVGPPSAGQAVPVLYNGNKDNSIDIVFIPNDKTYTGASDANFLSDASTAIGAYYNEKVYLDHQQQMNFWIARDKGNANGCSTKGPSNWDTYYAFADAGAVIHRKGPRDCQGGDRVWSSDAARYDLGQLGRVFLHETGHTPFGLADEYCCDGGYWDTQNLFSKLDDCKYVSSTTTCRQLNGGTPPVTLPWYTSDPSFNHLMEDNGAAQVLDKRGIDRVFDECLRLNC